MVRSNTNLVAFGQQCFDQIGPDATGAAGDENLHDDLSSAVYAPAADVAKSCPAISWEANLA